MSGRFWTWGILAAAAALTSPSAFSQSRWPQWDSYQTILWAGHPDQSLPLWMQRMREAGFTAASLGVDAASKPLADAGFGFYIENILPELAFLHARRPIFDTIRADYLATRDPRFAIRKPCFDDPAFWQTVQPKLAAAVRAHAANAPLLYDLRDEASIGLYTWPIDLCFCPHTLSAFRKWLQSRYASLAALNQEWETSFPNWDAVTPLSTFEIKDRESAALAAHRPENYAPWADHREYMDTSYARTLDRLRTEVHRIDPRTPAGIEGTQMPAAFGGFDLWKLSQSVDWIEPYDQGSARAILRSFLPPGAPVLATYFGSDGPDIRPKALRLLFQGDRGAIVWGEDNELVVRRNEPGMALTQHGLALRPMLDYVRRLARLVLPLSPAGDHIAIHYSQASIRAHWMFDSREDGGTWPRRFSSYETTHSRLSRVRVSFVKLIEDLALSPDFLSYEQIENGDLMAKGYRVLVLPESVAMSAAECRRIEEFVRAGGTVIADNMAATMDEHGRRLEKGQLDDLFGVRQRPVWKLAPSGFTAFDAGAAAQAGALHPFRNAPQVIQKQTGNGATFYLNTSLEAYADLRDAGTGAAPYLALMRQILQTVRLEFPVTVAASRPIRVWRYARGATEYIALLSGAAKPSAQGEHLKVSFASARGARELVHARDLGTAREFDLDLPPSEAILLELSPPELKK